MASKILANNIIDICPESFPNLYYILAEMAYLDHDYVLSTKYLRKSIDLGLKGDNYINAIKFLPLSNEKSTIISNPVKFNPKVVEGISTNYDEYLPTISPDQDYAFFTRRFLSADIDKITSKYEEKFISSTIVDGTYSFGFPLKYPFNVESNEGGAKKITKTIIIVIFFILLENMVSGQKFYHLMKIFHLKIVGNLSHLYLLMD